MKWSKRTFRLKGRGKSVISRYPFRIIMCQITSSISPLKPHMFLHSSKLYPLWPINNIIRIQFTKCVRLLGLLWITILMSSLVIGSSESSRPQWTCFISKVVINSQKALLSARWNCLTPFNSPPTANRLSLSPRSHPIRLPATSPPTTLGPRITDSTSSAMAPSMRVNSILKMSSMAMECYTTLAGSFAIREVGRPIHSMALECYTTNVQQRGRRTTKTSTFFDKNTWDHYEGEFDNDRKEGFGTLYFLNGDKFSGCFKDDAV